MTRERESFPEVREIELRDGFRVRVHFHGDVRSTVLSSFFFLTSDSQTSDWFFNFNIKPRYSA